MKEKKKAYKAHKCLDADRRYKNKAGESSDFKHCMYLVNNKVTQFFINTLRTLKTLNTTSDQLHSSLQFHTLVTDSRRLLRQRPSWKSFNSPLHSLSFSIEHRAFVLISKAAMSWAIVKTKRVKSHFRPFKYNDSFWHYTGSCLKFYLETVFSRNSFKCRLEEDRELFILLSRVF